VAQLGPDVARMAESIPTDRVAALLPALAEIRAWLDRDRDAPDPEA
jgi:hypothetical protein